MAEYRIVYYDGKIVRFCYKDYSEGGTISYMSVKVNDFIARLIRHIPDRNFPMLRYCGIFSNRWKRQYLDAARIALRLSAQNSSKKAIPTWAERQTDYTGINPLVCANCSDELTFVGAFFGNWKGLQYIFYKIGKDCFIPSALLKPG